MHHSATSERPGEAGGVRSRFPVPCSSVCLPDDKSPPDRGTPQSEGLLSAGGIRFVRFDTALARGPIDFPYPCRNGPGSGASEFSKLQSRPATPRPACRCRTSDRRLSAGVPSESRCVRDRPFLSNAPGRFTARTVPSIEKFSRRRQTRAHVRSRFGRRTSQGTGNGEKGMEAARCTRLLAGCYRCSLHAAGYYRQARHSRVARRPSPVARRPSPVARRPSPVASRPIQLPTSAVSSSIEIFCQIFRDSPAVSDSISFTAPNVTGSSNRSTNSAAILLVTDNISLQ